MSEQSVDRPMSEFAFPFERAGEVFHPDRVSPETVVLELAEGDLGKLDRTGQPAHIAFRVGLYALLADTMMKNLAQQGAPEEERAHELHELNGAVTALHAPLHFRYYVQSQSARARRLAGPARDTQLYRLKEWAVPSLESAIESARARIESLKRALGEIHTG